MFSIETGGFRFFPEDPFGAYIDLEIPGKDMQELTHKSGILLLPLLAKSRCMYGLVLVKVRGVRMHRRVGAIEIPLVEAFNLGENPLRDQRERGGFEKTVRPVGPTEKPTATGENLLTT
jgi:hypothetical protein